MLEQLIYPALLTIITATLTWLLARRKSVADGKMAEVEAEIKSAEFFRGLLDDAIKRINELLAISESQRIQIAEQRKQIGSLIEEIELLTAEIKKYKQLNGKSN